MIIEEQIQGKIKKIDVDRILIETDEDLKKKKAIIDEGDANHGMLNPLKQGLLTSLLDKRREAKVVEPKSQL
jgi:Tat protein secretion system quality control protein TatD with DNase activity